MIENSLKEKTWTYSALTQGGAISLAKTMQTKFGCKILSNPKKNTNSMWEFKFTNPFYKTNYKI
jgi:hypothetical protein